MTFFTAQRVSPGIGPAALAYRATHGTGMAPRSTRRAGRRMVDVLRARLDLTPQERADLYVSGLPTAVLGSR